MPEPETTPTPQDQEPESEEIEVVAHSDDEEPSCLGNICGSNSLD